MTALSQQARTQSMPGRVRLLLPPVIYAVPRIEANLYFDNVVLVLNRDNYAFEVICEKGNQLSERWTFTPEATDVGEYPIEVIVRDETNAVVARGRSKLRVVPFVEKVEGITSVLLVGASLTQYSIYPQQLLDLDKKDGYMLLRFIGSRGPNDAPPTGELRHEGYSGWTAEAFVTFHGPLSRSGYFKRPETGSPFVYETAPGKYQLDFARYCKEFNGGQGPDAITIQLMPNDVFTANDETIESRIDKMLGFYDTLITEFHRVRPDTRVGVILVAPPSQSQDGFRNYVGAGRQTRWQYRRNIHRALERVVDHYSGRENADIYLLPVYVNFDTEHHYPTWTANANARSSESVVRVYNGTHPSPEGYQQIADSIYCWLKAVTGIKASSRNNDATTNR
jgi:lysophospholipase L1-like esterase